MGDGLRVEGLLLRQGGFALTADFAVERGAVTAVMGPSGGGKSTLLGVIAGFVPVLDGSISWDGTDITDMPPGQRPLSILFQDNNLFPHLTIAQNIGLGRDPRLRLALADWAEVDAILERLGLAGMGARKPGELSGGQQSRAALGRVLLAERPLVLLDEPFAALGPRLKREMLTLATEVLGQAGRTMLMVSHDPLDARQVAQSVVVVTDGVAMAPMAVEAAFDPMGGPLRDYLAG